MSSVNRALHVLAFGFLVLSAQAQDDSVPTELEALPPFNFFEVLKGYGPLYWVVAALLIAIGLLHFAISLRSIIRPTPSITVPHHILFLLATPALVFLTLCIVPVPMSGGIFLQMLEQASVFGFMGLCSFVPNFLFALIAIYRGRPHDP